MVSKLVQDAVSRRERARPARNPCVSIGWSGQPEQSSRRSASEQVSHPPAVQDPCLCRPTRRQKLDRPRADRLASRTAFTVQTPPVMLRLQAPVRSGGAAARRRRDGPPVQREIGDECTTAADCNPNGSRSCDATQPGGYCTIQGCDETSCPEEAACMRYFPAQYLTKPCDPEAADDRRRDGRRDLPGRRAVRAAVDRASLLREDLLQRRRLPRRVRVPAGGHARQHGADRESRRGRAFLRAVANESREPRETGARGGRQPGMRRVRGLLGSLPDPDLAAPPARAAKAVDGVVNINTAEVGVLGLLPGIGPAKAAQIVVYRKRHPFRTVDELVRIRGIGRKMVRRLRAHLAVSGPTTATGAVAPPAAVAAAAARRRRRARRPRRSDPWRASGPAVRSRRSASARPTHGICSAPPLAIDARQAALAALGALRRGRRQARRAPAPPAGRARFTCRRSHDRQRRRLVVADRLARQSDNRERRLDDVLAAIAPDRDRRRRAGRQRHAVEAQLRARRLGRDRRGRSAGAR